jgi:hypothetical protein
LLPLRFGRPSGFFFVVHPYPPTFELRWSLPNHYDRKSLKQKARRAARRACPKASSFRYRLDSGDNYGGFQIVELYFNSMLAGVRYDISEDEVIEFCKHNKGILVGQL